MPRFYLHWTLLLIRVALPLFCWVCKQIFFLGLILKAILKHFSEVRNFLHLFMRNGTELDTDHIKRNNPISVCASDIKINIMFKAILTRTDITNTPSVFLQAIDKMFGQISKKSLHFNHIDLQYSAKLINVNSIVVTLEVDEHIHDEQTLIDEDYFILFEGVLQDLLVLVLYLLLHEFRAIFSHLQDGFID